MLCITLEFKRWDPNALLVQTNNITHPTEKVGNMGSFFGFSNGATDAVFPKAPDITQTPGDYLTRFVGAK